MTAEKRVTIKIPRYLYERLKDIIQGTGFSSVNEFIVYVMRDIASAGKLNHEESLSKHEIELIRKKLMALGYLPSDTNEEEDR